MSSKTKAALEVASAIIAILGFFGIASWRDLVTNNESKSSPTVTTEARSKAPSSSQEPSQTPESVAIAWHTAVLQRDQTTARKLYPGGTTTFKTTTPLKIVEEPHVLKSDIGQDQGVVELGFKVDYGDGFPRSGLRTVWLRRGSNDLWAIYKDALAWDTPTSISPDTKDPVEVAVLWMTRTLERNGEAASKLVEPGFKSTIDMTKRPTIVEPVRLYSFDSGAYVRNVQVDYALDYGDGSGLKARRNTITVAKQSDGRWLVRSTSPTGR